ncbi:hypothetical protein UA08_06900 [Talaromyces atroroseus]|uniref:Uncharacterized protein n=1 Tax=Talaromyces atroroseus TaxID=1441469 RepID=A0A225ARW8_TALAT|nr:hypothetical protein UA08_06900 [Talaromyces atroroseus]OKL57706.1 hypothetical protein UA08_06900 [Talaromyces atroroseus]
MANIKYDLVGHDSESADNDEWPRTVKQKGASRRYIWLLATLFISALGNIFLLYKLNQQTKLGPISRTHYGEKVPVFPLLARFSLLKSYVPTAGLVNDLDVPFAWDTPFSSGDYAEVNKLWYEDEQSDKGIISLDNDYAESLGLPKSQPFAWDSKKKSIYITNGHHNLHCLRNIYISLDQFRNNQSQTIEWQHVLHCLGALRDDIMCNADDTPRFTEKGGRRPGEGQVRKCRDWSKLQEFVQEHAGCFKYIHPENHTMETIERVKYCPNDSPYLPLIRKYFGLPDDWLPWPVEGSK